MFLKQVYCTDQVHRIWHRFAVPNELDLNHHYCTGDLAVIHIFVLVRNFRFGIMLLVTAVHRAQSLTQTISVTMAQSATAHFLLLCTKPSSYCHLKVLRSVQPEIMAFQARKYTYSVDKHTCFELLQIREGEKQLKKPFSSPSEGQPAESADLKRRLAMRRKFVPWGGGAFNPLSFQSTVPEEPEAGEDDTTGTEDANAALEKAKAAQAAEVDENPLILWRPGVQS